MASINYLDLDPITGLPKRYTASLGNWAPTEIGENETYEVPAGTCIIFSEEFQMAEGAEIEVNGILVESA